MVPESICSVIVNQFDLEIEEEQPVSGGSINRAHKLKTNQGDFFLKWNQSASKDFFEAEAKGLELLGSAKTNLRIPKVIASHSHNSNTPGFLLMEYINDGSGDSSDSFTFGTELAQLHNTKSEHFGLSYDNYIGNLPQKNGEYNDWTTFFVEKRINPQLKMAIDSGKLPQGILRHWLRLIKELDNLLPSTKPSLLHGDLWGGNYLFDKNGTAVIIDPAVYYGHPEMDLAFTKMFGGFSGSFYDGYESVNRLPDGFLSRVAIYNMYPLLVHINLFGEHYTSQFEKFIRQY